MDQAEDPVFRRRIIVSQLSAIGGPGPGVRLGSPGPKRAFGSWRVLVGPLIVVGPLVGSVVCRLVSVGELVRDEGLESLQVLVVQLNVVVPSALKTNYSFTKQPNCIVGHFSTDCLPTPK